MTGQPPPLPGSMPHGSDPGSTDASSAPPPLPGRRVAEESQPVSAPAPSDAPPPLPGQAPVPGGAAAVDPGRSGVPGRLTDPGSMPSPPPLPDPGALPDPAILHVTEDTRTYPCPSCGGMLGFDPSSQALKCTSCGTNVPLSDDAATPSPVPKRDLVTAMNELAALVDQQPMTLEKEVVCQSCGGHTYFTGSFTATRCPYCNTPIQRDDVQAAEARLKFDGIMPFQVPQEKAREEIEKWINGRWFAPNEFKKYRELGSFSSIYLSYFDYDAQTRTSYSGMRGENRYVTVRDGDNTRTEVRTDWYPASGVVGNTFADVTGLANSGLDEARVQELEPWPMELTRKYSPEFVAGHLSRTYDEDAGEVFHSRVRGRLEGVIDSTVRQDIGGDMQQIHSKNIEWLSLTFSQLALPVWMLAVTYKSRPFQVFINGMTGEVQGQRPYSAVKITAAVVAGILLLVVVILLYQYFGGS